MKKISVLIVDGSIYSADLNVREIKKAGFIVDHKIVTNDKAMEKALKEKKWDIILSDNSIPNFDVKQALEVRNRVAAGVPFLVVAEDVPEEEIQRVMKNGCSAYVSKEKLEKLRDVILSIL